MKCILFLAVCITLTVGIIVPKRFGGNYADAVFLQKQKFILDVFDHLHQPLEDEQYVKDGETYVEGEANYINYAPVVEFFKMYNYGVLPKNYIYSIFEHVHLKETVGLFNLFYYSKDWPTFYQNVLWARQNMNEGMFAYALTVAVIHRKDMEGIVLPPLHEICPYLFYNSQVIGAALNVKAEDLSNNSNVYSILANYSDSIELFNDETKLAYFTEDIGWNSYNYYFHIDYPFWMGGPEFNLFKDRRGELYLYVHQQLLARYYMERLSQNIGDIPQFSWFKPIKTGFNPHMRYYNGLEFASRKNSFNVMEEGDPDLLNLVMDYERRIRDVIDIGFYTLPTGERIDMRKPESVEFLGNIIQSNPDSIDTRFFDYMTLLARLLLNGNTYPETNNYKILPSVLEHFETAMRDPVFYQLYKRVINYYSQFKDYLTPYTYEDLLVPGVTIQDMQVTKLITYFEYFKSDITNAVNFVGPVDPSATSNKNKKKYNLGEFRDYMIVAKQKRLNHRPFVVSLNVLSEKAQPVAVRLFLGPKLDQFRKIVSLSDNRDNFIQIDQFVYNLPVGNVTIKRLSRDFYYSVKDRTTYSELYQQVMSAINGTAPFSLDMIEAHCGFPDRLLLPKGWIEGMPIQLFVMITPYDDTNANKQFSTTFDRTKSCGIGSGDRYLDNLPFGYPFDRAIDETVYNVPNMLFKDAVIYHAPKEMFMNMVDGWTMFSHKV